MFDRALEWMFVKIKGRIPFATYILHKDYDTLNPYNVTHPMLLDFDSECSSEACINNRKLKYDRYKVLKMIERIFWMRREVEDSKLPKSVKDYRLSMKKNN